MRETTEILKAFDQLARDGKSAALATVVAVGGSSYRRPGARMLIAADGRTWGGISGGCLERDVARRGRGVVDTWDPILARYDTTESPDEVGDGSTLLDLGRSPGVTLGCRGVIDLCIEPISADRPGPIPLMARAVRERTAVRCATLLRKSVGVRTSLGTRFIAGDAVSPEDIVAIAVADLLAREPVSDYGMIYHLALSNTQSADVFVETIRPPQSIVLFGGGSDVVPVLELCKTLGWHVTIVGGTDALGFRERFAAADALHASDAADPAAGVVPEPDAAVVLMTHDFSRDAKILESFAKGPIRYLGILGPRTRTERLLAQAEDSSHWNLFYPAGLDLGADTPELIALAIVAEMQAVLAGRPGGLLRDRPGPIYPRAGHVP
jgi:xanthine/CO dehydrogenase XdhC/CoxF family maturation factor